MTRPLPAAQRARLLRAARSVRVRAYVPASGFRVGAAVRGGSGRIYVGCNVENASYGLTICAERAAVCAAIAAGERVITAVAVVAGTRRPVSPCGACRQVLAEFAPKGAQAQWVIMATARGAAKMAALRDLLPAAFAFADLRQRGGRSGPGLV
jgi:cytidine deaminase